MKTINYYMNLPYKFEIIEDKNEGGYIASYPDLPGCITYADNFNDILNNLIDAKKVWLEAAIKDNYEIAEPSTENFSGQFKLRMPKTLHKTLAEQAKNEGISMNQYCIYLLSKNMNLQK